MPAGVRNRPKQEAAGPVDDLWGFRFLPRRGACATVVGLPVSGPTYGSGGRCSAPMLAVVGG